MPRPYDPSSCVPPGMTPKSRHEQKISVALMWCGVMGTTTTQNIIAALGVRSNALPMKLQRLGLLRATWIPGLPCALYSLSDEGLERASLHLGRKVSPSPRMDKLSSNTLAHDLMTQAAVLESLKLMATSSGMELDMGVFLRNSRESRDIEMTAGGVRPDLLCIGTSGEIAYAWEVERSQKGRRELQAKQRAGLAFAIKAGFRQYTIEYAIRGGEKVVQRYARCWEEVLEEAHRDGFSTESLSRVHCRFRSTDNYPGFR